MSHQQIHKLVLHPRRSDFALTSWDGLIAHLRETEILDKPINEQHRNGFSVGEQFLHCVAFMGCSPSLELTPPTNGSMDFCHIQFSEIYPETRFRRASQNVFARCPQCRKRISNWRHAISIWSNDSAAVYFNCDKCAEQVTLYQLGWRHTAGFGRIFIDVYSIYPQEGIPTDQFLLLLEAQTGTQWDYFFTDQ